MAGARAHLASTGDAAPPPLETVVPARGRPRAFVWVVAALAALALVGGGLARALVLSRPETPASTTTPAGEAPDDVTPLAPEAPARL